MTTDGSASTMSAPRPLIPLDAATKVCLLLAALLVVLGVYFLLVPLHVDSSQGSPFGCRTALKPPVGAFAVNSCGSINEVFQFRAGASFLSALIVGGGGFLLFGAQFRSPASPSRDTDDKD